jgi:N-acetyl-anhydromuramyl-L-alanine amidase AmpD
MIVMRNVAGALMTAASVLGLLMGLGLAMSQAIAAPKSSGPKTKNAIKEKVSTKADVPTTEPKVLKQLDSIRVENWWKHIVIHHTATPSATAKGIDRFHREQRHMENGMAYHFLIGNGRGMGDGEIFVGERWKRQIQGGHLAIEALNQSSIGICLVGNFESKSPTERQMESLRALTDKLRELTRLPASAVTTHRAIHPRHTSCPGKYFKM